MKTLETERLELTEFTEADASDLYECAKNPNVGPSAMVAHKDRGRVPDIIRELFMPNQTWAIRKKGTVALSEAISLSRIAADRTPAAES